MPTAPTPDRDPFTPPCCVDAGGECPQHAVLRRLRERQARRAAGLNPDFRSGRTIVDRTAARTARRSRS